MRLNRLILLFITLFFISSISAKKINISDAERVARNYYFEQTGVKQNQIYFENITSYKNNDGITFYIFDIKGNLGFVFVSAEDNFSPIIAYSNNSEFKLDGIPDNVKSLFNDYDNKITFIRKNKLKATKEITEQWNKYNVPLNSFKSLKEVNDVLLVTGNWNQSGGFDDWVPSTSEGQPPVGCVATALGEILNYWKYPMQGTGSTSYYSSFSSQILSVDFSNSFYPWNLMDDNNEGNNYEAMISYHCGVAVHMNYAVDGSGAYVAYSTNSALNVLKNYFKYNENTISYKDKADYSDINWKQILKNEIDNERPMLYRGSGSLGGHAWLCDGYNSSDLFHYNFGWGGADNGYFNINDVNGFTDDNGAIIGIQPSTSNTYQIAPQNLTAVVNTENTSNFVVDLAWDIPSTKSVNTYKIYRIDYENGGYNNSLVFLDEISSSNTTYSDETATPGEKNYLVQAIYSEGESEVIDAYIKYGFDITFNFKDEDGSSVNQVSVTLTNGNDFDENKYSSFLSFAKFSFVPWGGNYSVTVEKSGYATSVDNISFNNQDISYDIIMGQGIVGLNTIEKLDAFKIFPNPAKNILFVKTKDNINFQINIYDLSGKLIKKEFGNSGFEELNISNLQNGFYFIKIITGNKIQTSSFIKE